MRIVRRAHSQALAGNLGTPVAASVMTEKDLLHLERAHPEGLTSAQIVELFQLRDVKLSEATFRKYVQLGLLPRSRRVGRKGKHQGSMGLYPASTVRRVSEIKKMMGESYTIEEIQRSFLRFKEEIEAIERELGKLLQGFARELKSLSIDAGRRKRIERELEETHRLGDELVARIEGLERQIVAPLERAAKERAFSSGTSSGAGDLL